MKRVEVLEAPGSLKDSVGTLERRGGTAKYCTIQKTPREGGSPISEEVTVDIYILSFNSGTSKDIISFVDDEEATWTFRYLEEED